MENSQNNIFSITSRVDFCDTDAAGLMHFSTYFRFMEQAEAAFFRHLKIPLLSSDQSTSFGFPRIDVDCRFSQPLYFDDLVKIDLMVKEVTEHTLTYHFKFFQMPDEKRAAKGHLRVAFVEKTESSNLKKTSIPKDWLNQFRQWENA